MKFCLVILILSILTSCSSKNDFIQKHYQERFYLDSKKDIKETLNGNTFIANVGGVNPIFGDSLTIKVRGLRVESIESEDPSISQLAFRQWHKFKILLKEANEIEIRNLERGQNGFWVWADLYLDGKILEDIY